MLIGNSLGLLSGESFESEKNIEPTYGDNIVITENIEDNLMSINLQEDFISSGDFISTEEKVKEFIKNIPLVGIGDSVMLGASANIVELFPNAIIDAKVSRSIYGAIEVANNLKEQDKIGNPIIIGIGTNGEASKKKRDELMEIIGSDKVCFWVTVTNDQNVHANANIKDYPNQYPNMHVIDWEAASKDHTDYFYNDGIHLTPTGRKAYANLVYDTIYNYYLNEYSK